MKKSIMTKIVATILCGVLALGNPSVTAMAAEDTSSSGTAETISGQVMMIDSDAAAYSSPDESGNVVHEFKAGETMFVLGENNGWYEIFYQGQKMYVSTVAISNDAQATNAQSFEEHVEELDKEFDEAAKADKTYIESWVRQRIRARNSMIWKISIAVLVVLILGVSVFIGVSNSKKAKAENASKEEKKTKNID